MTLETANQIKATFGAQGGNYNISIRQSVAKRYQVSKLVDPDAIPRELVRDQLFLPIVQLVMPTTEPKTEGKKYSSSRSSFGQFRNKGMTFLAFAKLLSTPMSVGMTRTEKKHSRKSRLLFPCSKATLCNNAIALSEADICPWPKVTVGKRLLQMVGTSEPATNVRMFSRRARTSRPNIREASTSNSLVRTCDLRTALFDKYLLNIIRLNNIQDKSSLTRALFSVFAEGILRMPCAKAFRTNSAPASPNSARVASTHACLVFATLRK